MGPNGDDMNYPGAVDRGLTVSCDRCQKPTAVTFAVRGPVSTEMVCLECKRKPKERNAQVAEPLRSIINDFSSH